MTLDQVVSLLGEADGQLGLAVYRGEAETGQWRDEAIDLMHRLRAAARDVKANGVDIGGEA